MKNILVRFGVFPLILYFSIFVILTYPLIFQFSSHFWFGIPDGFMNTWNLWWINKSVTELHQSIFYTEFLNFPFGISLLGHTLAPANGLLGIVFLKFFSLLQTYNLILILGFVLGGYTAFLLANEITKSYWGSIIAGFIFTFSSYHFAHTDGHLELITIQWIPLFVLFWYKLIIRPKLLTALFSAATLVLVFYTSFYYFLYCVIIGILMLTWYAVKKRDFLFFFKKEYLIPILTFTIITLISISIWLIPLFKLQQADPLMGGHNPAYYSADLLSPLIPGNHWKFGELTRGYWSKIKMNPLEPNVHLGISVLIVLIYSWKKRKKLKLENISLWYAAIMTFMILSLGPVLHVWGEDLDIPLPYGFLESIFPPLKLSGVPNRMMLMVTLSASIIFAAFFKYYFKEPKKKIKTLVILLIILILEYLPAPLLVTQVNIPEYVEALKKNPDATVVDLVNPPGLSMYYQTIHEKPLTFSSQYGYLARASESVFENYKKIINIVDVQDFQKLYCTYGIKYMIVEIIDPKSGTILADLSSGNCENAKK